MTAHSRYLGMSALGVMGCLNCRTTLFIHDIEMRQRDDGAMVRSDGRVAYVPQDAFEALAMDSGRCVFCALPKRADEMNDEHIIPDWVLRLRGIHRQTITGHGSFDRTYSHYRIPCCIACNTALGERVEVPVSTLIRGGYAAVIGERTDASVARLYCWMALIYLKNHLKDGAVPIHLDQRQGTETWGGEIGWRSLHHVYCLARCLFGLSELSAEAMGSLLVVPVKVEDGESEQFDYCDLTESSSAMIRIGDLAVIAAFRDCGNSGHYFAPLISEVSEPLAAIQLRELFCRVSACSYALTPEPVFQTMVDLGIEECRIEVQGASEARAFDGTKEMDFNKRGLYKLIGSIYERSISPKPAILAGIKEGTASFLLNDKGNFQPSSAWK